MSTARIVGRIGRSLAAGARWIDLRKKDAAWLAARHHFEREAATLLQSHEWVFIVGCNNSGTTLIHDVLAATGQFSFLPHEGQRYTSVLRRGDKRGHERVWSEYLDELRLTDADATRSGVRLLFDWLAELEKPVKPRVLEKTTVNAVRMRWLDRVFPRAAFVGVVRDGYAVAEGIKRKARKSPERAARHWARINRLMLDDAKSVRRFSLVRYEDFVARPHETLATLGRFLDLPAAELQRAFASFRASVQDMNALSLQRLDRSEVQTVTREAGAVLSELGYLIRT